jgi:recyclin-1
MESTHQIRRRQIVYSKLLSKQKLLHISMLKKKVVIPVSTTSITELPPPIFSAIFKFLPLQELNKVSRVSRRFKVLSYQDEIYREKLEYLGMTAILDDKWKEKKTGLREGLLIHLQQLPGGTYLPGNQDLLIKEDAKPETTVSPTPTLPEKIDPSQLIENMTCMTVAEADPMSISAALPEFSKLIIGAGGLKAALAKQKNPKGITQKKMGRTQETLAPPVHYRRPVRETFKQVFLELYPYYIDFKDKQTDSKVFKDFKHPSEVGAVLARLRKFDKAGFFVEDMEEISFSIQTISEWFESTLLGQFEIAYDENNIAEMKKSKLV